MIFTKAEMWEHPDPAKRYTRREVHSNGYVRELPGFWRECMICGEGSTDLEDDPNFVKMIRITFKPTEKKFPGMSNWKGKAYDKYYSFCHPCFYGPLSDAYEAGKLLEKERRKERRKSR